MVLEERMALRKVTERTEISYRHAKRLKHVAVWNGPNRLVRGNTVRRPVNAIDVDLKAKIVALS
jgi:hypothetical protein